MKIKQLNNLTRIPTTLAFQLFVPFDHTLSIIYSNSGHVTLDVISSTDQTLRWYLLDKAGQQNDNKMPVSKYFVSQLRIIPCNSHVWHPFVA